MSHMTKKHCAVTKSLDPQQAALLTVLDWYVAMGVDTSLGEVGIDWRAHAEQPRPGSAAPKSATQKRPHTDGDIAGQVPGSAPIAQQTQPAPSSRDRFAGSRPPQEAEMLAREQAKSAQSLEQLEQILRNFDGCALKATAKNLCFYRGSPTAPIAIIGEAPGRDEDMEGKPFVGRAGQLLDKMISSIGLTEDDVHITNIVYWRPPGNRTPTPLEALICRPFLIRQMELLSPKLILVLGGSAAKNILGVSEGIMRLRGKWRTWKIGEEDVPVMASLHPAYLLRTPAAKRLAWRDLLAVNEIRKTW